MPIGILSFLRQRTQNIISDFGKEFDQFNKVFRGPDLIQQANRQINQQAPKAYQSFRNTQVPVPFLSPQMRRPTFGAGMDEAQKFGKQFGQGYFNPEKSVMQPQQSFANAAGVYFGGFTPSGTAAHAGTGIGAFALGKLGAARNASGFLSSGAKAFSKAQKFSSRIRIPEESQIPKNIIKLDITGATEKQRVQSAIVNSERIKNEISVRGKDAFRIGTKLHPADLKLAEKYQEGIPIDKLAQQARNPNAFKQFMKKTIDYYDFRLSADRAVGGHTPLRENYLRQVWDLGNSKDRNRFNELAAQRGVQPWNGFSAQPRIFKTYAEGEAQGFKRVNPNLLGDLQTDYGQASHVLSRQTLKQGLKQAAPDKVSMEGMGTTPEGKSFINSNIHGLEGISYHPDIHNQLKGFESLPDNLFSNIKEKGFVQGMKDTGVIETVGSLYDAASRPMKQFLLNFSGFHSLNVSANYAGATLFHPARMVKGLAQSVPSFFSEGITQKIENGFKSKMVKGTDYSVFDAGLRSGVNMDRGLSPVGKGKVNPFTAQARAIFDRELHTLKLNLVDQVFGNGKLNPESPQGQAAAKEINMIMGEVNNHTMNLSPNVMKWLSRAMLAPQFTTTKYKVLIDAATKGNQSGGGLARQAVIGKSLVMGSLATFGTLLATGKFPNLKQILTNYTTKPDVQTNLTNPKGQQLDVSLPATFLSEPARPVAGLLKGDATALEQYGQSRLNPVLSAGQSFLTGKDFYGKDTANPDSQVPALLQVAGNIGLGKLPIGIQNVVGAMQGKQTLTQAAIGVAGLRTHISPNDPTAQFFSAGGTTTPERQVASYLKSQGSTDKEISSAVYHYSAATRLDKLYTAFTYDTRKAVAFNAKFKEVSQKDPAVKDAYLDTSSYLKDNPNITEVQLTQFAKKALDFYNKRVDQQYLNPAKLAEDQKTSQNMQNILPKQQRTIQRRIRKGR